MSKLFMGAAALLALATGALTVGAASAQDYAHGPRPPYATGAYLGLGLGNPDCSFTIVGGHAGMTVLGIDLSAGARLGLPGRCRDTGPAAAYSQPYAAPPAYPVQPYYRGQDYQGGGYYSQGYSAPPPPPPVYGGYPQPCNCQGGPVYQPY